MPGVKNFWVYLAETGLAIFLILIAIVFLLPPNVFWSPDGGGKYLQMLSIMNQQDGPVYAGKAIDSDYHFYPQGTVYPRITPSGGLNLPWLPLFSFMVYPFWKVFGAFGLYIVPVLSAVGLSALCAAYCRRGCGYGAFVCAFVCVFSTPVLFYSVLFWEHNTAALFCILGLCLGAYTGKGRWSIAKRVAAFISLGVAVMLRYECLIFVVAFAVAMLLVEIRTRKPEMRWKALFLTGSLVVAAAAFSIMVALGFVHIFASKGLVAPDNLSVLHDYSERLMSAWTWQRMWPFLQGMLVNNSDKFGPALSSAWVTAGLFAVLAAFLASLCPEGRGSKISLAIWLASALCLVAISWKILAISDRYRAVHSIFGVSPLLLAAFVPRAKPRHAEQNGRIYSLANILPLVYLGFYILVALPLGVNHGGPEWGLRYAMPIFPLLIIRGCFRVKPWLKRERGTLVRGTVGVVLAVLLIVSLGIQARGVAEIARTKRDLSACSNLMRQSELPIVTDLWWLPSAAAPVFAEKPMFYSKGPAMLAELTASALKSDNGLLYVTHLPMQSYNSAKYGVAVDVANTQWAGGFALQHLEVTRTAK